MIHYKWKEVVLTNSPSEKSTQRAMTLFSREVIHNVSVAHDETHFTGIISTVALTILDTDNFLWLNNILSLAGNLV